MAKKIIAWLLLVTLSVGVAIGGTLAYFTDRESEANVFTVGNVDIDLKEDFQQNSPLLPGVAVEKKPTIVNLGPNDAWVWATVAVPKNLDSVLTFGSKGETWKEWVRGETTIDGRDYVIYTVLYPDVLTKGQETEALFGTVTLDRTVDIDPDGSWHTLSGGDTALGWSNSDGNPTILVSAYAIQKEKFDTVEAACEAFAAQWGINSTQP